MYVYMYIYVSIYCPIRGDFERRGRSISDVFFFNPKINMTQKSFVCRAEFEVTLPFSTSNGVWCPSIGLLGGAMPFPTL